MKNKNNKFRFFNRDIFLICFFFLAMLGSFFVFDDWAQADCYRTSSLLNLDGAHIINSVSSWINEGLYFSPISSNSTAIYACNVDQSMNIYVNKSTDGGSTWIRKAVARANTYDAHNKCAIGIDSTGFIHIAYDMHASDIKYMKSDSANDITSFSEAAMTGVAETAVTYPMFYNAPDGNFYFSYRSGITTNSDQYIKSYNTNTKAWSDFAAPLISGSTSDPVSGVYSYPPMIDNSGNIYMFWTWNVADTGHVNILYAKYNKSTAKWQKSDGTEYTLPITVATAEVIVSGAETESLGIQNNGSLDTNGKPHIAYQKRDSSSILQIFHTYFNGTSWITSQVSNLAESHLWGQIGIIRDSNNILSIFAINNTTSNAPLYVQTPNAMYRYNSSDVTGTSWSDAINIGITNGADIAYDFPYYQATGNLYMYYQPTDYAATPLFFINGNAAFNIH